MKIAEGCPLLVHSEWRSHGVLLARYFGRRGTAFEECGSKRWLPDDGPRPREGRALRCRNVEKSSFVARLCLRLSEFPEMGRAFRKLLASRPCCMCEHGRVRSYQSRRCGVEGHPRRDRGDAAASLGNRTSDFPQSPLLRVGIQRPGTGGRASRRTAGSRRLRRRCRYPGLSTGPDCERDRDTLRAQKAGLWGSRRPPRWTGQSKHRQPIAPRKACEYLEQTRLQGTRLPIAGSFGRV